jgi:hypothetical protein
MQTPHATQQDQNTNQRLVYVALPSTEWPRPQLLDAAFRDAEGVMRGMYSHKTCAELQQDYKSSVQMMRMCDFDKLHDEALRTEPEEITEAEYDEAFFVLPPMKFHNLMGVESFRMTEFYSGNITTIYAMCEGRYWKFLDNADMDTHVLVDKVRAAMLANPAAEVTA